MPLSRQARRPQAFAVASVIATHYDSLRVDVASFRHREPGRHGRSYEHGHSTSDALAGALIGTAVGTAPGHWGPVFHSPTASTLHFLGVSDFWYEGKEYMVV